MRIVVAGASRGLGAALAVELERLGHEVIALSRSKAAAGRWIAADLSSAESIGRAADEIGPGPLDALIHVAGIWEETAFSPDYDFAGVGPEETRAVLDTNLLGPILLARGLLGPLRAGAGRVIWIGSTSGLPGVGEPEVAYGASKAGLMAAAGALAVAVPDLAVTTINPGDFAETGRAGLPMADLVATVRFVLELSGESVVTRLDLRPREREARR